MSKQSQKKITLTKGAAQEFASHLYQENGNQVTYIKLCEGNLKEGKLHCAIGEAYHTFVNTSLKNVLKVSPGRVSEYNGDSEGPTGAAIDALIEVANLKEGISKERLAQALRDCVEANDYNDGSERAKVVASTWTKKVVPLLK